MGSGGLVDDAEQAGLEVHLFFWFPFLNVIRGDGILTLMEIHCIFYLIEPSASVFMPAFLPVQ